MAVVTRYRKGGTKTYYVKFRWNDEDVWELSGHDKRAARSLNAQRLQEVRDGTYNPELKTAPTFREYARKWLDARTNRNRAEDRRVLDGHVLTEARAWFVDAKLESLSRTPAPIRRLLDELRATVSEATGKTLAVKTVANIYGLVRSIFKEARKRDVISRDPCDSLERKEIPRKGRKRRTVYALDAIRAMVTSETVHPSAKMFAALAFLTGGREGEICGLRWSDWDLGVDPLTCLTIDKQYDGQPLKTDDAEDAGEHARRVPVHPLLAKALHLWWQEGWMFVHGRRPSPSDPIVPRKGTGHHTKSSAYKMWRRACAAAGVTNVSLHSTRHTFITLARRKSLAELVEKITHNAKGEMIDQYTHREWDELCSVVSLIDLDGRAPVTLLVTHAPNLLTDGPSNPGSIPGASTITIDNDSSAADDVEPPRQQKTGSRRAVASVQWDARHQASQSALTHADPAVLVWALGWLELSAGAA